MFVDISFSSTEWSDDDHNVGGAGEFVDVGSETFVPDDHALELVVSFNANQFELLNDVRNLLKAMDVLVSLVIVVSNHKESAAIEKEASSAPQVEQNCFKDSSNCLMLGSRMLTI